MNIVFGPGAVHRPEFAAVFSGNAPLPGGPRPYAQAYGGHQFGSWAGQLGDGRAINLGAAVGPDGQPWELQLKVRAPSFKYCRELSHGELLINANQVSLDQVSLPPIHYLLANFFLDQFPV